MGFFLSLSWIAVALRLYVRVFIVKAFGWDDGWMFFAQLLHTLNSSCAIGGALTGSGRHINELTSSGMMMALRVRTRFLSLGRKLTLSPVLVDLLHVLLSEYDRSQSICWPLDTSLYTDHQKANPLHHSHRHLH